MELPPSTGPSRAGYHRIESFMTCPRRYAFEHEERLERSQTSPALARGTLVHLALAHHYGQMAHRPWAEDPVEVMRSAPDNVAYVFEEARAIYLAYRARYPSEPFRVIDVEREFEVKVGPHDFTARLDLVAEMREAAFILESKTGADLRSPREWQRAGQFLGQVRIGAACFEKVYGLPFGGIICNQLRTGEVRDFRRDLITCEEQALRDWPRAILYWLGRIDAARAEFGTEDAFRWPANFGACMGRYGMCPFFDACQKGRFLLADWRKKV